MKIRFVVTLVLAFLVIPYVTNALDIDDEELLLFFPCNEEGDVVEDWSPHGNDGEVVGTVEWVDGKYGMALSFEETGEVKAPHIPLNDKSFTICMWVKAALSGGSEQCVFSQMQANAQNTSLHYRIYTNGTIRMGFYSNDLDAPGTAVKDEWIHICFWLDVEGKSRKIFINGEQVAEDAGKAGIEYKGASGDTMIGSWSTSGQKFNGVIDEVQVWDRALSEAEINDSMGDLTIAAVDTSGKLTTTWGKLKTK
jgi:hypothetical protein